MAELKVLSYFYTNGRAVCNWNVHWKKSWDWFQNFAMLLSSVVVLSAVLVNISSLYQCFPVCLSTHTGK